MNNNRLKIGFLTILSVSLLTGCGTHSISSTSASSFSNDVNSSSSNESSVVSSTISNSESDSQGTVITSSINKTNLDTLYGGYYKNITSWENGEDLKEKLYNRLRDGYNPISYDDPNWETNSYADQALEDLECVDVVYGDTNVLKTNTNTGWQREHAFCASLMTGYTTSEVTTSVGRATDFHNLFASFSSGNSSRSNKNLGIAAPYTDGYVNVRELDSSDGDYSYNDKNFEPSDKDKGRLARAIFYMGVMYSKEETAHIKVKNNTSYVSADVTYKGLKIIEEYVPYSKVTYKDYLANELDNVKTLVATYGEGIEGYVKYSDANCEYAIGNLSSLLLWNSSSKVDRLEYQHNESVYSHIYAKENKAQGNRNPFVDFPNLVDYVYGDKKDQPGKLEDLVSSYDALSIKENGLSNIAIKTAKRSYSVGDTFSLNDVSLVGINNDFSISNETVTGEASDYIFAAADASNNSKILSINTSKNVIKYRVDVLSDLITSCNYKHNFASTDFVDKKVKTTPTLVSNMGGVNWLASGAKEVTVSKSTGMDAASIGKSTGAIGTFTLETQNEFTYNGQNKVKAIYIQCNPASGKTYYLTISIGEYVSKNIDLVYTKADPDYKIYGLSFDTPYTGKIKIVVSGIDAAFNLQNIGIKTEA